MCGILGVVGVRPPRPDIIADRLATLAHRGPDNADVWISSCGRAQLGHRRLSIIDVSHASDQPMTLAEGQVSMVFNGEIYNYAEVRDALRREGVQFSSAGDTEVLLKAYLQWGEDCLHRLNGMFAFAILDLRASGSPPRLFFARDRAGEKPFYYRANHSEFMFASELKTFGRGGEIDETALNHYLALGYIPDDQCLVAGTKKLPPGHCGVFDLTTAKLSIRRYWALPAASPSASADGEELADRAAELITDSVRLRLIADVPVGILLSGGLDSSLLVAAAARVSDQPIKTFTMALPGDRLDEAGYAQIVASHFGTQHHVLPIERPTLQILDAFAPFVDEPIADSSILPAFLIFGHARQHVKVALGGDGGDELFGGYTDYTAGLASLTGWGRLPRPLLRWLAAMAEHIPPGVRGRTRLISMRGGPLQQQIWGTPYFSPYLRRQLFHARSWSEATLRAPEHFLTRLFCEGSSPVDRMTRAHFGAILPDDFLVKVDRASMAHSLEMRAPYLDHRLIEFAFRDVPDSWKVANGQSRRLQRLLGNRWLPSELDIARKQGFSIPINEWLRAEGEQGLMERLEHLPAILDRGAVRKLVRGHLKGRSNGGRLFALIMLSLACRNLDL